MGHLINPVAYRLGYFSQWTDIWMSTNNLLYSEILHNSLMLKDVMAFFFENFVTDKYSIFYSHFTVEESKSNQILSKLYFYDGIVEQKVEFLSQFMRNYNKSRRRKFSFFLRRFKFLNNKHKKINILFWWRYFDYLLAKKIVFLFTFFLGFERRNISRFVYGRLKWYYFVNFDKKWFKALKENPQVSVLTFIKDYIAEFLFIMRTNLRRHPKIYGKDGDADESVFLLILKTVYLFWAKRQAFFRFLVASRRIWYKHRYKNYMSFLAKTDHIVTKVFNVFFRLYLVHFRQSYFFKFMYRLLNPLLDRFAVLKNNLGFFGLDNDTVTSTFLSRYIARKLELRFKLKELFGPITKDLRYISKHKRLLRGYKLQFIGRITRRDRLKTSWALGGCLPLSTMNTVIEHSYSFGILRNGICSIRVWLYRHKSFGNYNYNYKYNYVLNA